MAHKDNQPKPSSPILLSTNPQKKVLKTKAAVLLSLFMFAIGIVLYFMSPLSDVELLSVSGNREVTDQEVVNASQVRSGDPLWDTYFSKNEVVTNIVSNHPQIKTAEMKWAGINDFEFVISEWQTVAYMSENEQYYKILENGDILDEAQDVSIGNRPIFREFVEGEALNRLLDEFSKLDPSIHNLISEVKYSPTDTNELLVHVFMNDGNQVLASIPVFSERMQYYPAMVQSVKGEKGLFDLEAGAFFTPFEKGVEEENESETSDDTETEEAIEMEENLEEETSNF